MKFIGHINFKVLLWLGRRLGDISYLIASKRRHVAMTNIALAFPEKTTKQQKKLVRQHFQSLGMGITESLYAWNTSKTSLEKLGNVRGLEHLPKDKGAILLLSHFTSLEIGCTILSLHAPMTALFKEQNVQWLNDAMIEGRTRFTQQNIYKDDIKGMIKALKNKQYVIYAADQHTNSGDWMFVDFFNTPAATRTSTSRIAKITGADVLPLSIKRLPNYTYQITIHPKLENFGEDAAKDTQTIMTLAEEDTKNAPEQYFWTHKRFKTHPDGTRNRYEL